MKRHPQKALHFVEKEMRTDLGKGNFIFVGSSTDVFADDVPAEWITRVLGHCRNYPGNTYLFQSKNPKRFGEFIKEYPPDAVFATTLETNRENDLASAPSRLSRTIWMQNEWMKRKMITIEPIMDFDVHDLMLMVIRIWPEFVNIGADSNKMLSLPEPSAVKVKQLIAALQKTAIKTIEKNNLSRILEGGTNVGK